MQLDIERRLAIAELLARPDPPELRRGHRLRLDGKPERYRWLPMLAAVFVQQKLVSLQEHRAAAAVTEERLDIRWVVQSCRPKEVLTAA